NLPILITVPIAAARGKDKFSASRFVIAGGRERNMASSTCRGQVLRRLVPLIFFLACGCTSLSDYIHNGFKVGPNYTAPPAPLAKDWIDPKAMLDADDKRPRSEADDLAQWWRVFNDPYLDQLIDAASKQNLTLRQAGFRILQARALRGIAIGEL